MRSFVGRREELRKIADIRRSFEQKGQACLIVIKGRRRLGKSRLIEEAAKGSRFLAFSGLAPTAEITAQDQRDVFSKQLSEQCYHPQEIFSDWNDAFYALVHLLSPMPTLILFDEISWMGSQDPTFVPKLKALWDLLLQNHPQLTLVFCGSVSTWIEENIINSTGFFGRISLVIDLQPLSLPECARFLDTFGFKGSNYDIYKLLAVCGGIPWYLEQLFAFDMADANIKRLCFTKDGLLTTEFDRIFCDLFHQRGPLYKSILITLAKGMATAGELRRQVQYPSSGTFSTVLHELISAGFITQHYQWSLQSGRPSKFSLYRLSDPYIRFYLKYIEPNILKISQNSFEDLVLSGLPGWDAMMGFQVESLLLKNRPLLLQSLNVAAADIVADNPYFQRTTSRHKGCQVDYLVQTYSNNLFFCEFKFKKRELGLEVIEASKEAVARFSMPRRCGIAPVLFHLNGVTDRVYEQHYFYRIIDIGDFLQCS